MEHGLEGPLHNTPVSECLRNGLSPIMANFPDSAAAEGNESQTALNVVSENALEYNGSQFEDSLSSESDALVIDEKIPKKRRVNRKYSKKSPSKKDCFASINNEENNLVSDTCEETKDNLSNHCETVRPSEVPYLNILSNENTQTSDNFSAVSDSVDQKASETETSTDPFRLVNNSEIIEHSNPYFHESLFELSQLHHLSNENLVSENINVEPVVNVNKPAKPKGQLKEYAQYLGLQPAVQFKCPKCGKSGFESLTSLQEHIVLCSASHQEEKVLSAENVSGFKITRKVFLCSTCGTYYENWNLYLHMLEHHKRYICLYCLGMFSALEDLCQHIQSRHNVEPGVKESLDDFYNTYNDPCYIVCCECNKQFQEGDDFIHHQCLPSKVSNKPKSRVIKQVIAPENHITGDYCELSQAEEAQNAPENNMQLDKDPSNESIDNKKSKELIPVTNNEGMESKVDEENLKSDSDISDIDEEKNQIKEEDNKSEIDIDDAVSQEAGEGADSERDSPDSAKHSPSQENTMDGIDDEHSDEQEDLSEKPEELETRKVPKLSLKLPKPSLYNEDEGEDSNASNEELEEEGKTTLEINYIESENDEEEVKQEPTDDLVEVAVGNSTSKYPVAGAEVSIIEIELDQPLDKIDISVLLQKCLSSTAPTCIYCNHSRKIAVNGKQLALHAIAEHRFSAINKSITEEELTPTSFNMRIEECLPQLEDTYFNLESGASGEAVTFSHLFECFQCHYSTTVHKELYLHNRKFHSKNLLLCIMCKTIFYSYSELICHLCPGLYVLGYDTQFRCCMCVSDHLPSSFRLMVHLRKRHNVCDVCLEMCHGQYKLSNHVWKHKLHHFCYRCGIAYRNKPDITRHLFWKHGTESVLCKKCLQKKWPHVYHFCVPPPNFTCEECNLMFTRAVSLKVHKRIHTGEKKHPCTWEDCTELFISKKLMLKHLKSHTEPPEEVVPEPVKEEPEIKEEEQDEGLDVKKENVEVDTEEPPKPVKPKVDVYDLPELNLSESESSDSESEPDKPKMEEGSNTLDSINTVEDNLELSDIPGQGPILLLPNNPLTNHLQMLNEEITSNNETLPDISEQSTETSTDTTTMQEIWDNFKTYQANKEKMDNILIGDVDLKVDKPYVPDIPIPEVEEGISAELALRDHDYCVPEKPDAIVEVKPSLESTESMDHDYCSFTETDKKTTTDLETPATAPATETALQPTEPPQPSPRKRNSSTSSTSSGSDSSCSCGSNCSCSDSSSGSSSSTSDSSNSDSSTEDGRKRQLQRRLKRKERSKAAKKEALVAEQATREQQANAEAEPEAKPVKTEAQAVQPIPAHDMPIRESDLETTESETDEEFYDREPLKFAKKILEEKRAQLIADVGSNVVPNGSFIESTSRPPTPPAGTIQEEETHPKRKKKTKKRKKRKSERKAAATERTYTSKLIIDPVETVVPPPPPSVPYYQQFHQTIQAQSPPVVPPITLSLGRNSPAGTPHTPPIVKEPSSLASQDGHLSDTSGNVRASKRRRVPNKFYGYSSDEEDRPQSLKRTKVEINRTIPAPSSPMLVPPITIKTVQPPLVTPPKPQLVEPITLKLPKSYSQSNEYSRSHKKTPTVPPLRISAPRASLPPPPPPPKDDSATESNDSDLDESPVLRQPAPSVADVPKATQPQLYCYCRCPYDEVSEMIGCDSNDCEIEWFHFECVGIMVPPKGQWFCPDCRKKKQQRLYT
ncbi:uncharacterized protein LOC126742082 [Anthonomus grandis grandis]|uniref:uncharacterized protein LOC126742082 n=1 Tax=Anthonomus grandis grandis TaxID=2921223 RepID=UPI0021650044|nr:uncharacterized protein LOC126742082 [Anthonomus grandis grandis]XP_050304575.1 uncharacterized protein LOC126742082 [Anthonomus grandis grandis]